MELRDCSNPSAPYSSPASNNTANACLDKGTLCSLDAFMRSAGIIQHCLSTSISSHVASNTSDCLVAVRSKKVRANRVEGFISLLDRLSISLGAS